jgi:hypothetical protein
VLQARIAVVEREAPVKSLVDLHFGPREAEAARLLGNLEATTLPLHDIVIADDAFVHEAADPFETFWNRKPSGLLFAGLSGEAAVVISDELAQHGVGRVDVNGFGQPQFAGETILEHPPKTLDAAFGLRAASRNESNAELFEGATELGGLAFSGELLFDGPVVIVARAAAVPCR